MPERINVPGLVRLPAFCHATRAGDLFPKWLQNATRIELYGTKRQMILARHGGGWTVYVDERNAMPSFASGSGMSPPAGT